MGAVASSEQKLLRASRGPSATSTCATSSGRDGEHRTRRLPLRTRQTRPRHDPEKQLRPEQRLHTVLPAEGRPWGAFGTRRRSGVHLRHGTSGARGYRARHGRGRLRRGRGNRNPCEAPFRHLEHTARRREVGGTPAIRPQPTRRLRPQRQRAELTAAGREAPGRRRSSHRYLGRRTCRGCLIGLLVRRTPHVRLDPLRAAAEWKHRVPRKRGWWPLSVDPPSTF